MTQNLQLGVLEITPEVEQRLKRLGYTPEILSNKVDLHRSQLEDAHHPAVYCSTYGKYNLGSLQGLFIDLTTFPDYDSFITFCQAIHADENDPELMFQDFEYFPREWYNKSGIDEKTFNKILHYFEVYEEATDKKAFRAFLEYFDADHIDSFQEQYLGHYDSECDFAISMANEMYDLEKRLGDLNDYFDYDAYAKSLFDDGYVCIDGYVFRNF